MIFEEAKNSEITQFEYISQCGAIDKIKNIILSSQTKMKT